MKLNFTLSLMLTIVVGLVVPDVLAAQPSVPSPDDAIVATSPDPVSVPTASPIFSGPRIVQVGVTRSSAETSATNLLQGPASRRDVSWMLIGGAAIVVGSVVDGDAGTIIMVSGAVIGLIGLWRYLQYS